ncbi:MAG: YdbH domain-containing protein [Pseudomonadales bacterium]
MIRVLFRLLLVLSVLALPLILAYALFPVLAPTLVAREALALGVEVRGLRLERPGLNGLRIHHIDLFSGGHRLDLSDLQLSWTLTSLRRGRLVRVDAGTASLTLATGSSGDAPTGTAVEGETSLFGILPFDAARIETLSVNLPALSFAARGRLDFEADRLSMRLEGLSPAEAQGLVLAAALSGGGGIELALAGAEGSARPFLSVRSNLPQDRLDLTLDADLGGFALDLAAAVAGLPRGSGQVSGELELSLPWPLDADWWQALVATGPMRADWRSADGRFELTDLKGDLTVRDGVLAAALSGGAGATWSGFRIALAPTDVRLVPAPLSIDVRADMDIQTDDLRLTGSGSGSISDRDASARKLTTELDATLIRDELHLPLSLRGDGVLEGDRVSASLLASSGPFRDIPLRVLHDTVGQRTAIRVDDHAVSFSKPLLRNFWPGWQEDYDLDGGTLRVTADLVNGPAGLSGTGALALERVAAHAGSAVIRGMSGTVIVRLGEGGPRIDSDRIRASLLDVGVPMRNVEVTIAGTPTALSVSNIALELLGGRATATPFDYRVLEGTAETLVSLADLDLAQVLALEGEHVTGNGRLDGTLPVRVEKGEFSVLDGRIAARAPGGDIRLQPSIARAITQPGLDVALTALTNFHYTLLESTVNYSPQGDLALGVRLEGRNPDVERGRPIHFNLNVSENIPVLLRSLRLKDEFAERIERKMQR